MQLEDPRPREPGCDGPPRAGPEGAAPPRSQSECLPFERTSAAAPPPQPRPSDLPPCSPLRLRALGDLAHLLVRQVAPAVGFRHLRKIRRLRYRLAVRRKRRNVRVG